jgi:hypothetical protein
MRKRVVALAIGMLLALGLIMPVGAHVHGITPLSCLNENANSGALRADDVSPVITGLIPRDVGHASLTSGDGGRNAAPCQ